MEKWGRTRACFRRKRAHLHKLDKTFPSREHHILSTTLKSAETVLEPNRFSNYTPRGIEHWTLWSRREMDAVEIEDYVCGWLRENKPHVECWNYDSNASRSIDVFHVHVYLKSRMALICM